MGINPDEAVAYGAAIQAGIISGEAGLDNMVFIDVCPIALGIETIGGIFSPIIQANTPLPARKSEIYSTSADNQRTVTLKVFQGEDVLTTKNVLLGTFELSGIPLAARGVPQIEVVFEVDNNGIMIVSANSKESRMSEEIDQMAAQDEKLRNRHAKLNEIQSLITQEMSKLTEESHLYTELERHAKWVESIGQTADIAQLQECLSNVQAVVEFAGSLALSLVSGLRDLTPSADTPLSDMQE
ncbi:ATPase with role in protein import into the ER, partial [Ceratobasidium sp. 423]